MSVTQEVVRDRLKQYVDKNGSRFSFIGKAINTPDYVIRKFVKSNYAIWDDTLDRLDKFLIERNF